MADVDMWDEGGWQDRCDTRDERVDDDWEDE